MICFLIADQIGKEIPLFPSTISMRQWYDYTSTCNYGQESLPGEVSWLASQISPNRISASWSQWRFDGHHNLDGDTSPVESLPTEPLQGELFSQSFLERRCFWVRRTLFFFLNERKVQCAIESEFEDQLSPSQVVPWIGFISKHFECVSYLLDFGQRESNWYVFIDRSSCLGSTK